jgi:formylglycine-generating enzyme required for sulfatase activity
VLADWLEERGDPRFELVRLQHDTSYSKRHSPEKGDERIRELLASGIGPLVPTITNSIGMKFALIPPGKFLMGSLPWEKEQYGTELQHEVEITRFLFLGLIPVTQEQYWHIIGYNPSCFSVSGKGKVSVQNLDTSGFPVETVSWDEARSFCRELSKRPEEKKMGRVYRLPTEAEWEYACRGGAETASSFSFGNSLSSLQANFDGNDPYGSGKRGPHLQRPSVAGSYSANAFGLFDMHGNVWEWCSDWYEDYYYRRSPKQNPHGPRWGEAHILRGGAWNSGGWCCRSAIRNFNEPDVRDNYYGFRVVCVVGARTS